MRVSIEPLPHLPEYVALMYGPVVLAAATGTTDMPDLLAGEGRWGHIANGPLRPLDKALMLVAEAGDLAKMVKPVAGESLTFTTAGALKLYSARCISPGSPRITSTSPVRSPAVFKHEGKYYMIASGLTGWDPNEARSYVANAMFGPWTPLGNPCVGGINPHTGIGPEKTFGGQNTFVLPAPEHEGEGKYIVMFDVWYPKNRIESRYVWLPMEIVDGKPIIRWHDTWDLSIFDGKRDTTSR